MEHVMKPLKYPDDRLSYHGGSYVQLRDGDGNFFVPDFSRSSLGGSDVGDAMKYAGVFLVLSRRLDEGNYDRL
jgi:hypothetical protein